MINLRDGLTQYVALRRALGTKLQEPAITLGRFLDFLEGEEAEFITSELALRWAMQPQGVQRFASRIAGACLYNAHWAPHRYWPPPGRSHGAGQIRCRFEKRDPRDSAEQIWKIPLRAGDGIDLCGSCQLCQAARQTLFPPSQRGVSRLRTWRSPSRLYGTSNIRHNLLYGRPTTGNRNPAGWSWAEAPGFSSLFCHS